MRVLKSFLENDQVLVDLVRNFLISRQPPPPSSSSSSSSPDLQFSSSSHAPPPPSPMPNHPNPPKPSKFVYHIHTTGPHRFKFTTTLGYLDHRNYSLNSRSQRLSPLSMTHLPHFHTAPFPPTYDYPQSINTPAFGDL